MRLLLDTHSFLWFINGDSKLSLPARNAIEDIANERYLSIASLWEMSIKYSIGKLQFTQPFQVLIPEQLNLNSIDTLSMRFEHTVILTMLPFHHRDPFDRMIIAQAIVENMAIVGNDSTFDRYGVPRIWQ